MDLKDVAAISYEKAFNKKWWESKRAIMAHGSGTGKALDEWQKKCKKDIDKMSFNEVQDAEATCALLRKGLKVAMSKCGDKQKETTAGCKKYLKLVDDFETELANRSKQLSNATASVIVTLEKFHAKTIVPAGKLVSTLAGALAQVGKRVQKLQAEAEKVTLDKDKENLLRQIADEIKTLEPIKDELGGVGTHLNEALKPIQSTLDAARKDPRFRKALVEHQKHEDAVRGTAAKFFDAAQNLANDLGAVRVSLAANETADEIIKAMSAWVNWLTLGQETTNMPAEDEDAKEIAAALIKEKNPATLSPETWDQIDLWEDKFRQESMAFPASFQQAERFMTMIQAYGKRWKDQPDIQGLVKQASEAFNTYKRHYVTYDKLNSAIRARINELNKERK